MKVVDKNNCLQRFPVSLYFRKYWNNSIRFAVHISLSRIRYADRLNAIKVIFN